MGVRILIGDTRERLKSLPDGSVHCCVTSPPYFGLRSYLPDGHADKAMEIGLEPTPAEFVEVMVGVFREVRRVLRSDGVVFLNLGDSYWTSGQRQTGRNDTARETPGGRGGSFRGGERRAIACGTGGRVPEDTTTFRLKPKDLIGIPWRVAFALQADGWVLRQEIIWSKPNPMPESVTDRCTKAHESLFLFAKAKWSGPRPGRFAHISDQDARWLALLIDAEGSIVVKRNKHESRADTYAPQVSVGNTSEALMREVVRIVGHGNLLERPGKNCRMLYWQLANGLARDFLHRIYPFLIVKQRQARIGIHVDSLTYFRGGQTLERKQRSDGEAAILESLWARNKLCNQFGAPDLSDVPEPEFGQWGKSERYHFDAAAIAEPAVAGDDLGAFDGGAQRLADGSNANEGRNYRGRASGNKTHKGVTEYETSASGELHRTKAGLLKIGDTAYLTRNRRSVWTVATAPFAEAHFATFPPALVEPCILAGCPKGGTVLDPFGGAGTTGLVADRLGRNAILIELNPEYAEMARNRIHKDAPMFADVEAA